MTDTGFIFSLFKTLLFCYFNYHLVLSKLVLSEAGTVLKWYQGNEFKFLIHEVHEWHCSQ